jgi:GH18 family chitinase
MSTGNTLGKAIAKIIALIRYKMMLTLQFSGNGEDYKQIPNSERAWEIEAYPQLLQELRTTIGPGKLMSAAVPGLERDMIAFTSKTVPAIMSQLDFLNVMTYDLMNRRDNVTKHHTGVSLSLEAIDAYIQRGASAKDINLGFAFYTKWIRTERCPDHTNPIGCPTRVLEDPVTGADMGQTGAFSWHDNVPEDVADSLVLALSKGQYDEVGGGYYYWDNNEDRWWTFDNPDAIQRKFPLIVENRNLGGVFAWGLGEDAPEFRHLQALNKGLEGMKAKRNRGHIRDEL